MDFSLKGRQSDFKRQHQGVPKGTQQQTKKQKQLKNQRNIDIKRIKDTEKRRLLRLTTKNYAHEDGNIGETPFFLCIRFLT
jgi:hypothetical protein